MQAKRERYRASLVTLSPKRLLELSEKRDCLELLCLSLGNQPPDRYGSIEPLRRGDFVGDLDKVLEEWHQGLHSLDWKRDKPNLTGGFHGSWLPDFLHSNECVITKDAAKDQAWLCSYFEAASNQSLADYAVLHVVGQQDVDRSRASGGWVSSGSTKLGDYTLFPTTHRLRGGLPNMFWSTVLGRPYVSIMGRNRLLSCPDADVVELDYGGIRVTSRLPFWAARTEPEAFENWRDTVREHIGREFFVDAPVYGKTARVPQFEWI